MAGDPWSVGPTLCRRMEAAVKSPSGIDCANVTVKPGSGATLADRRKTFPLVFMGNWDFWRGLNVVNKLN